MSFRLTTGRLTNGCRLTAAALLLLPPAAARAQDWDRDARVERGAFTWAGAVPAGRWIYVRNLNGPIRVERATGDRVEVTADRRARGGADPRRVRFVAQKAGDGQSMVVCALWNDRGSCDERGSHYDGSGDDDGDRHGSVSVDFTVRVPAGVRVDVNTVNGGLEVRGASGEVVARTVNGGVRAETDGGPVSARTVNGSIDARMSSAGDARELDFGSVNGSVSVELPASLGAEVELSTVNGGVNTDFPVTIQGRIDPRHLRATLGDGSRRVRLHTVNGSVSLRRGG